MLISSSILNKYFKTLSSQYYYFKIRTKKVKWISSSIRQTFVDKQTLKN